jgi:hypothetical protein
MGATNAGANALEGGTAELSNWDGTDGDEGTENEEEMRDPGVAAKSESEKPREESLDCVIGSF